MYMLLSGKAKKFVLSEGPNEGGLVDDGSAGAADSLGDT
jgi:hypothetical protein